MAHQLVELTTPRADQPVARWLAPSAMAVSAVPAPLAARGAPLREAPTPGYGVKYGGAVKYAADPHGKVEDISFQGVTTYSSKDLVHITAEPWQRPR